LSTAISAANAVPATLRLAAGCTYRITGTLPVTGTVALFGGPSTAIASSGFAGPLIDVAATGRLRGQGIFLQGGRGTAGADGGGIRNAGGLVLNFVTVRDNATNNGNGGGPANLETARALIAHTVFTRNLATGGGVSGSGMGGGVLNRGSMTLFESRVSANTAEDAGGGIAATGTTRVIQSIIDHNGAAGNGGGMLSSGTTALQRTLVVGNRAGSGGACEPARRPPCSGARRRTSAGSSSATTAVSTGPFEPVGGHRLHAVEGGQPVDVRGGRQRDDDPVRWKVADERRVIEGAQPRAEGRGRPGDPDDVDEQRPQLRIEGRGPPAAGPRRSVSSP
jgi:predicted outer membrane repeat protein